jgi:hypothetical protein
MSSHRITPSDRPFRIPALALAVLSGAAASPLWAACETSTAVTLNATYRGNGDEPLKVTTGGGGILTLDVSSAADSVQPKVTFLGTSCTTPAGEGEDWDFVRETPAWIALAIYGADTYFFEVEPQNSQETLDDFKLRAAWIADPTTPDENNSLAADATDTCSAGSTALSQYDFDQNRFVTTGENIEEWDDDVMRLVATAPGVVLIDIIDAESESVAVTLYEDDTCSAAAELAQANLTAASGRLAAVVHAADHSLKVEPYQSADGDYEVATRLFAPCGLGETDDHGDASMCSTAIVFEGHADGELDNASDDDEDWFNFVLAAQETVEIESTGSTDTRGSLYDGSGQLLETDDDDGDGSNFFISRTLGAGRYFVRVEGAEGEYGVEASVAP